MKKTFYIASSSERDNIRHVRRLAEQLKNLGMAWELDWTQHANISAEKGQDPAKAQDPEAAVADIEAAQNADLFILLVTKTVSRGAHIELGARLASGRLQTHVILEGNPAYFFYYHPNVTLHSYVTPFMAHPALLSVCH